MFVSIYYKPSLFNAHTMILIFHIFMNVNKLCLNQTSDWLVATTQTVNMSLVGQQELFLMQRNSLSVQSGINISPRPVQHESNDTRVFVTTWFKQSLFHVIYS